MRAPIALLAAAALAAGCSVDIEGAKCASPGGSAECPSGQACGNDRKCSKRAAACVDRCDPTDTTSFGPRCSPDGKSVQTCKGDDPVCGSWQVAQASDDCEAQQLTCKSGPAVPTCQCKQYVVHAPGAPLQGGVNAPAVCEYTSIATALAAAGAHGVPTTVVLAGTSETYTGEAFPLTIPADVTLTGIDSPLDPAQHVIVVDNAAATEGVHIQDGSALAGVTIENSAATGIGVRVSCAAKTAKLTAVSVLAAAPSAGPKLATGMKIEDECEVDLANVSIRGASGAGLDVDRGTAGATVLASDAILDQNGIGVRLAKGDLTLQRPLIRRNANAGIDAQASDSGVTTLTVTDGVIYRNLDTGVLLSANAGAHVERTRICGNNAVTDRGPVGQTRKVGGMFADGPPPALFVFRGNKIHNNDADQVVIAGSATPWDLDGSTDGTCGADVNTFAGYQASFFGIVGASAAVNARYDAWMSGKPTAGADYKTLGTGQVIAGPTPTAPLYCTLPADLDCPLPPP